jgi:hypothetical protein
VLMNHKVLCPGAVKLRSPYLVAMVQENRHTRSQCSAHEPQGLESWCCKTTVTVSCRRGAGEPTHQGDTVLMNHKVLCPSAEKPRSLYVVTVVQENRCTKATQCS